MYMRASSRADQRAWPPGFSGASCSVPPAGSVRWLFLVNGACATRATPLLSGEEPKSFTSVAHVQRFSGAGVTNMDPP